MSSPDVTAVVNLHRERESCVPTLRSLGVAASFAVEQGHDVEILVLLDNADDRTREVARSVLGDQPRYVESTAGDLGLARNRAVDEASGTYACFLDGDDLWGFRWIARAFEAAESAERDAIWHPATNFVSGKMPHVYHHVGSEHRMFKASRFRLHNGWTALSFARTSIYRDIPYPPNLLKSGFGYEDWSWNTETLRRGIPHRVVEGTSHYINKRESSLLTSSVHALPTRYHTLDWNALSEAGDANV